MVVDEIRRRQPETRAPRARMKRRRDIEFEALRPHRVVVIIAVEADHVLPHGPGEFRPTRLPPAASPLGESAPTCGTISSAGTPAVPNRGWKFAPDSPLEGGGFELPVPRTRPLDRSAEAQSFPNAREFARLSSRPRFQTSWPWQGRALRQTANS